MLPESSSLAGDGNQQGIMQAHPCIIAVTAVSSGFRLVAQVKAASRALRSCPTCTSLLSRLGLGSFPRACAPPITP